MVGVGDRILAHRVAAAQTLAAPLLIGACAYRGGVAAASKLYRKKAAGEEELEPRMKHMYLRES